MDSRCKTGFSDLEDSAKTRYQNIGCAVRRSAVAVAHATHVRLESDKRTIKGWHTAVDQLNSDYIQRFGHHATELGRSTVKSLIVR
jgi:hypothetical protein